MSPIPAMAPHLVSAPLELPSYLDTSPDPDEEWRSEEKPMNFEVRCSCPLGGKP